MVLVVDVANVMGSRPDGWWRDRAEAASRLMVSLVPLVGGTVAAVDGPAIQLTRIIAVLEGKARVASVPAELEGVLAPTDGDTAIVAAAERVLAGGEIPLVVTADRGLRDRLPTAARFAGPGWLLGQV